MIESDNLSGTFLISVKNQRNDFFSRSLIWIIKHSDSGPLGLIVNKPVAKEIRGSMGVKNHIIKTGVKIQDFGPIDRDRLFLIHTGDLGETNSFEVKAGLFLSEYSPSICTTATSLCQTLVGLGYSGRGRGQLESEIVSNGWLIAPFDRRIVFDVPNRTNLFATASSFGVDLNLLSRNIGNF